MPIYRASYGHPECARRLKSGELPVSETNDTSVLWGEMPKHFGPAKIGFGHIEGDLAVYDWKPAVGLVGALGLFIACTSAGAVIGIVQGGGWGWWLTALLGLPLGLIMLIWYPFVSQAQRLVIFDRRRSLVHLPRWFSRRLNAVRWEDVNVLIVDEPSGYMGKSPYTVAYVVRPGWSLTRDGYPGVLQRLWFQFGKRGDGEAEAAWRFIVSFMTEPPVRCAVAVEDTRQCGSIVELRHEGDWAEFRRQWNRHFSRLYGAQLLTEPNWVCDPDGSWRRLPDGPREEVTLPDGPSDRRVPVQA